MRNLTIKFLALFSIVVLTAIFTACTGSNYGDIDDEQGESSTYSVTYNLNGADSGTVPSESKSYSEGETVLILPNTGNLIKNNYTFGGWCFDSYGSGVIKATGDRFIMLPVNATLYAKWIKESTYRITYYGNNHVNGTVPEDLTYYFSDASVTVLGNTGNLEKIDCSFRNWNTEPLGSGSSYNSADKIIIKGSVVLYAQWTDPDTYGVIYHGNGNTGGRVPEDLTNYVQGDNVNVKVPGSLVKNNNNFIGWNTESDGTGIAYDPEDSSTDNFDMQGENVKLYAQWKRCPVIYDGNGATGGDVPIDSIDYGLGATVSVKGNPGSLENSGMGIEGWNTKKDGTGTTYSDNSNFGCGVPATFGFSSEITLYAKWEKKYIIGATGQAGGIIFYDQGSCSNGWRFLEAAPTDAGNVSWGCDGTSIPAVPDLGVGKQNTIYMINGCPTSKAANLCLNYTLNGYSDWYLPSHGELYWIWYNLWYYNGVGDFYFSAYYWSSNEDGAYNVTAREYTRYSGYNSIGAVTVKLHKTATGWVRPVRQF